MFVRREEGRDGIGSSGQREGWILLRVSNSGCSGLQNEGSEMEPNKFSHSSGARGSAFSIILLTSHFESGILCARASFSIFFLTARELHTRIAAAYFHLLCANYKMTIEHTNSFAKTTRPLSSPLAQHPQPPLPAVLQSESASGQSAKLNPQNQIFLSAAPLTENRRLNRMLSYDCRRTS